MTLKYKSILAREDKSVVFRSGDIEIRWDSFHYLKNSVDSCHLLSAYFKAEKIEDYIRETSGENALSLNSFRTQENQSLEEIEKRKKQKVLFYRGFIFKFGISPSNFKKVFNAIMCDIWCIQPYFNRYCFTRLRKIEESSVQLLHKHIDLIKEAQEKNQNNIVPFIFYSGLKSEDLRTMLGNKLWDSLCKNSHTKNHLIAKKIKDDLVRINLEKNKKLSSDIAYYNKIPSTILKKVFYAGEDASRETILALLHFLTIKEFLQETSHTNFYMRGDLYSIIYKTIKKAKSIKKNYCLSWTKDEWLQKHEEYEKIDIPW